MRKKINEVFTPRNPNVNSYMYINRIELETGLLQSAYGSFYPVLFGESGSGKSWLYKKVFLDNKIEYIIANSANASRNGGIVEELLLATFPNGRVEVKKIYFCYKSRSWSSCSQG